MSRTVPPGQQAPAEVAAQSGRLRRRGRGRRVAAGLVVVLAAGGLVSAWSAGVFGSPAPGGRAVAGASAPATATVTRQDLSLRTPESATLGYAGSYTVTGRGSGTLTWLPPPGRVISEGQVLYRVDNGTPVILLYGSVPAWRALSEGMTGADVTQLNHDLVHLGYANRADIAALGWDYFSWDTRYALEQLQQDVGISSPSGSLALGAAVFEPSALRVSADLASLGNPATGAILSATSPRHVVTISLSAALQSQVKAGDAVTVTLPDGTATPGVISSVGAVATGSDSSATIAVYVRLTHPQAAGSLDQAPVTVQITSTSVHNVLAVPVGALLAQPSGGYAVEVTGAGGTRHLVRVTVGIFDDAAGLVQVSGTGLAAGQHVVVPAT
jgi:hypothetical protein